MKLKKSLIALTTATAVAMSGTAVAAAETPAEDTNQGSLTLSSDEKGNFAGSLKNENESGETTDLAGSLQNFFKFEEDASGLDKLKSVVGAISAIVGLVGGIAGLIANFQKIEKLFK